MTGRRILDNPNYWRDAVPGDYWRTKRDGEWVWMCCCPVPVDSDRDLLLIGDLSRHDVTEHDDGTITVSPSIACHQGTGRPSYHGFLESGVWRSA